MKQMKKELRAMVREANRRAHAAKAEGRTVYHGNVYEATRPQDGPARLVCKLDDYGR